MRRIAFFLLVASFHGASYAQAPVVPDTLPPVKDSFYLLTPVEVMAIRAGENAPFTRTNLSGKAIKKMNLGQDLPFLLNQTPSVVVNSDAGNGIGYTGIRIRGTDATRINVTLNGIPYNDAESQGSFFVDLPDFLSSTGSVQVQRGVGTSSNGAGAFGASINLSTNELNREKYAEFNNSVGSFNSWKNTLRAGTGLINDRFTADLRLSHISSNGFIDRASSRLRSIYFSTAWLGENNSIRLNVFSGKEKTYQAWYGIAEADRTAGNRTINYAGTERPGAPYENETDNYRQDHFQLFLNQKMGKRINFTTAFFLTKGKGFYEQYKADQDYSDYNLAIPGSTDLVRQLWLKNDFYGTIFSLQYKSNKSQATFGGAYTRYEGNHFGEIIWAANGLPTPRHRWYDLDALKTDITLYLKEQTEFAKNWSYYYDLQVRRIRYSINGFRNNPLLKTDPIFHFINPKAGISYHKGAWKGYISYGIASKEPNRDDFEAGTNQQPKPERLYDIESGIEQVKKDFSWSACLYHMHYQNQLVLTGKINDVGAYTRTNIRKSFRSGVELTTVAKFAKWINASANLALSRNKLDNFREFIDDYDNGGQQIIIYPSSTIAFSPSLVAGTTINFIPKENLEFSLISKYVSKQYLDNTANEGRKLDPFYVQDLRLSYTIRGKWFKEVNIIGQINNLLNTRYEPNGYTYNYILGRALLVNNYYFPMAGINFMLGVNIRL